MKFMPISETVRVSLFLDFFVAPVEKQVNSPVGTVSTFAEILLICNKGNKNRIFRIALLIR